MGRTSKAPTIREIAAKCGYSRSAVAGALRGQPDIPETTRKKICKVAQEMGYRQDAEIQRLMSYLRSRQTGSQRVSLALVHAFENNTAWFDAPWNKTNWQGLSERADQLGFSIELVSIEEYKENYGRIGKVLFARGIKGVIIGSSIEDDVIDNMGIEGFSCIRTGTHPWRSRFHNAYPDYAYNMNLALDRLLALGYQRPLLHIFDSLEDHTEHLYHSTFLWWQKTHLKAANRLAPRFFNYTEELTSRSTVKLVQQLQPDVVVCNYHNTVRDLTEEGIKVPEDVGVIHLNLAEDAPGWSGIEQCSGQVSAAAIDILAAQFHQGEVGPPEKPRSTLIQGEWVDGATTRERR